MTFSKKYYQNNVLKNHPRERQTSHHSNLKPANDDFTDVDDIFFVTGDDFHGFGISETVHSDGVSVNARDSRGTNFGLKLV